MVLLTKMMLLRVLRKKYQELPCIKESRIAIQEKHLEGLLHWVDFRKMYITCTVAQIPRKLNLKLSETSSVMTGRDLAARMKNHHIEGAERLHQPSEVVVRLSGITRAMMMTCANF